MLVGYMRVSSDNDRQVMDLQRDALIGAGVDGRHLYEDQVSGSRSDRSGLAAALAFLQHDDCLVVWKLDRLGRSLPHLLANVNDLKTRGIAFRSLPSPAFTLKGRNSDPGITNIRNVQSRHWRRWLGAEHRCVVPFTSFSENEHLPDGTKPPVWFAFDETRPLAFFAGVWTRWTSVRKVKEGETTNDVFGFLTTEPNREVYAIHPKAMPVIFRAREEIDLWMAAPTSEALKL
jgi:putative SOS response-associated peptidase YedK